ncbi:MAG: hypothetical protein V3T53_03650, partial [Phycisphaerales bacterium]
RFQPRPPSQCQELRSVNDEANGVGKLTLTRRCSKTVRDARAARSSAGRGGVQDDQAVGGGNARSPASMATGSRVDAEGDPAPDQDR